MRSIQATAVFLVMALLFPLCPVQGWSALRPLPRPALQTFFLPQALALRTATELHASVPAPHGQLVQLFERREFTDAQALRVVGSHWRLRRAQRRLHLFRKSKQKAAALLHPQAMDVRKLDGIWQRMQKVEQAFEQVLAPFATEPSALLIRDVQALTSALEFFDRDTGQEPMLALAYHEIANQLAQTPRQSAARAVLEAAGIRFEDVDLATRATLRRSIRTLLKQRAVQEPLVEKSPHPLFIWLAGHREFFLISFVLIILVAGSQWVRHQWTHEQNLRQEAARYGLSDAPRQPVAEHLPDSTAQNSAAPVSPIDAPVLSAAQRSGVEQEIRNLVQQEKELAATLAATENKLKTIQAQASTEKQRSIHENSPSPIQPQKTVEVENFQQLTRNLQRGHRNSRVTGALTWFNVSRFFRNGLRSFGWSVNRPGQMDGIATETIPSAMPPGKRVEAFQLRESFTGFFKQSVFDAYNRARGRWDRTPPSVDDTQPFFNLPGENSINTETLSITQEFTTLPVAEGFVPVVDTFAFSNPADYDIRWNPDTREFYLDVTGHLPVQMAFDFAPDKHPLTQTPPKAVNLERMEDRAWETDTQTAFDEARRIPVYRGQRNHLVNFIHKSAEYTLRADLDRIDHHPIDHVPSNVDRYKEKVSPTDPRLYRLEDCGTSLVLGEALLRQAGHAIRVKTGYMLFGQSAGTNENLHIQGEDFESDSGRWETFDTTPPKRYLNREDGTRYDNVPILQPGMQKERERESHISETQTLLDAAQHQLVEQQRLLSEAHAARVRLEARLMTAGKSRAPISAEKPPLPPLETELLARRLSQTVQDIRERVKTDRPGLIAAYADPQWIERSRQELGKFNSVLQTDYLSAELELVMESLSPAEAESLLPNYVRLQDAWTQDPAARMPQRFFSAGPEALREKAQFKHWNIGHSFPYEVAAGVPNSDQHFSVLIPGQAAADTPIPLQSKTGRQVGFIVRDEILDLQGRSVMGPPLNAESISAPVGSRDGHAYVIVHPGPTMALPKIVDILTGKEVRFDLRQANGVRDIQQLLFPSLFGKTGWFLTVGQEPNGQPSESALPVDPTQGSMVFMNSSGSTLIQGRGQLFLYNRHGWNLPLESMEGSEKYPIPEILQKKAGYDVEIIFSDRQEPLFVCHTPGQIGLYDQNGTPLSPPGLEDIELPFHRPNSEFESLKEYAARHLVDGIVHRSLYAMGSMEPIILDVPGTFLNRSFDKEPYWKIEAPSKGGRKQIYFRIDLKNGNKPRSALYNEDDIADVFGSGSIWFRHRLPDGRWEMRVFKNIGPENTWVDEQVSTAEATDVTPISSAYSQFSFGERINGFWHWRNAQGQPLFRPYTSEILDIDASGRVFFRGSQGSMTGLFVWDGTQVQRLSDGDEQVNWAVYAPGTGIYYVGEHQGKYSVKHWTAQGPVTVFPATDERIDSVSASPNGDVYFAMDQRKDQRIQIYRIGTAKPFTLNLADSFRSFYFSPDGKTVYARVYSSRFEELILLVVSPHYRTGAQGDQMKFSPSGEPYHWDKGILYDEKGIRVDPKSIISLQFGPDGSGSYITDENNKHQLVDLATRNGLSLSQEFVPRQFYLPDGSLYYLTTNDVFDDSNQLVRAPYHQPLVRAQNHLQASGQAKALSKLGSTPESTMGIYWARSLLASDAARLFAVSAGESAPLDEPAMPAPRIGFWPQLEDTPLLKTGPLGHSALLTTYGENGEAIIMLDPSQQLDLRLAWAVEQQLSQSPITKTESWRHLVDDLIGRTTDNTINGPFYPARRRVWLYFLAQGTPSEKVTTQSLAELGSMPWQQAEARAAFSDIVQRSFNTYHARYGAFALRPTVQGRELSSLTHDIEAGAVRSFAWRFKSQANEYRLVTANQKFEALTEQLPWLRLSAKELQNIEPGILSVMGREVLEWEQEPARWAMLFELLFAGLGLYVLRSQIRLKRHSNHILHQWVEDFHLEWVRDVFDLEHSLNAYVFEKALKKHPQFMLLAPFLNQSVERQAAAYLILVKTGLLDRFAREAPAVPMLSESQRIWRSVTSVILKDVRAVRRARRMLETFAAQYRHPLGSKPIVNDQTSFLHFMTQFKQRLSEQSLREAA